MMRTFRSTLLALSILIFACVSPSPLLSQETTTEPVRTPTVDQTPSAMVRPHVVRKLSLKGKIAIAVALMVVAAVALAFSIRTWSSSNLFGRQYRLPAVEFVALRLGGKKSGGHMGTIAFDEVANAGDDSVGKNP